MIVLLESPHLEERTKCIALDPLTGDRHMTSSTPLLCLPPHHLLFIFCGGRRWNMVWDSRTGLPTADGTFQIGALTDNSRAPNESLTSCKTNVLSFAQNTWSHTLTPLLVPFSVTSSSLSFRYQCRYHCYQKEILTLPHLRQETYLSALKLLVPSLS